MGLNFLPSFLIRLEVELLGLDGFFAARDRHNVASQRALAVGVLDKVYGLVKQRVFAERAFRGPIPVSTDENWVEVDEVEEVDDLSRTLGVYSLGSKQTPGKRSLR